jgi:hypothetical protein
MTFFNRRTTLLLGRFIVLMLLFAQSLYAAQPCQMPAHDPAMAFTDMAGMDCDNMGTPNACLQQCTADDQSTGQPQVAVAVMPVLPALTVPLSIDPAAALPESVIVLAHSPDPPHAIRFCSFQL